MALPLPELLTVDEVADVFRVSPATIRAWARDGKLKTVRLPGNDIHRRFRRSDVEALIAADSQAAS